MDRLQRKTELRELLSEHGQGLYGLAYRMTLDETRAAEVVEETFLRAYLRESELPVRDEARVWLSRISLHVLDQSLARIPEVSFDVLDEVLRSPKRRSRPVPSACDPDRGFRVWDTGHGCLSALVVCLPPTERAAFSLCNGLDMDDADAASAAAIGKSELKSRLARANKKIGDYLGSRCFHLESENPCRCPAHLDRLASSGAGTDPSEAEIHELYGAVPDPEMPEEVFQNLAKKIDGGDWDELRRGKVAVGR